jgi:hypothetical protein
MGILEVPFGGVAQLAERYVRNLAWPIFGDAS